MLAYLITISLFIFTKDRDLILLCQASLINNLTPYLPETRVHIILISTATSLQLSLL